jgi:hypothetical protein
MFRTTTQEQTMNLTELEPILDPRGRQERTRIKLAHRVSEDDLKNGHILFYNNTKLGFCEYEEVFVRIKQNLRDRGIQNFVDFEETVRGKSTKDLQEYAEKLASAKPTAAIVALGDMGTSAATTVVSIALEMLGIPTVYIIAPPGAGIAKGVAFYRAGHLCMCEIDIYQGSTKAEVAAEVDKHFDIVIETLTLNGDELEKHAKIDFHLDPEKPCEDGFLAIPDFFKVDETSFRKPGSFMEEFMDIADYFHIGDGLPLIPPTPSRLDKMYSYCPYDPELALAHEIGPTGKDICVKDVAVAAVMAGCKPRYMPILVAAFKAMSNIKYNFLQSVTTSHPGGTLILVSGPLAKELHISGGQGCLGPCYSPNATIGRAANLVILNVTRAVPGFCDLDCLASQAEFTYCFAEDPELTRWETINVERFSSETTTVYVLKAEPPHDIIDFLSENGGDLLDTLTDCATTLGSNNAYVSGPMVYVITPDHAWMLERDGYTKESIREHIFQWARNDAPMVRNRGLMPIRPKGFNTMHPIPVARSPKDIEVVVAGGRGGHSAVILPWALYSEAIVEPVLLPNGTVPKSIEDFRR